MDKDNYIGRLLDGRYEILEVIGTGGMAVVYKARCHRLNRLVAIKILKDEYSQDEEFRRRFHAESQAVAMLSHPNIVSVYDVSSSKSADFIVMELIDGITLKQYMEKKGVLNWKETLHFAIQIAKALEHAHGRGIVHRDIKPHNVMVLKNGSVKVADFGIAQITSKSTTLTKEALGSVHYISPEQAKGGRVDNRSDIYSLGIVMYEMISGRVPYDGDSPVNVAIQHINGGAPKPSEFNPNTPEGLEQIIAKAMGLTPQDRYPSATAMLYDMDEFRKDPTMVFQMAEPAVDQATRALPGNLSEEIAKQPPKTIAERTAAEKNGMARSNREKPQPSKRPRQVDEEEEEEGRNRVAAIAIASCVVVGVIAIIIFMVILIQGGLFTKQTYVQVPSLVGQLYENLRDYPGIEVVRQGSEYSDEYQKGEIMYQHPNAGIEVISGTKVFITVSLGEEQPNVMESLVKMKAENAEKFLDGLKIGLHIIMREENSSSVAAGYVTRTSPAAGEPLTEGQTVTIWVSTGPEVILAMVPNVVGKDIEDAIKTLNANGFDNIGQNPVDSDRPKDQVVGQSAEKFVKIDVTTLIILDVSTGVQEMPTTPIEPTLPTEPDPSEPTEPEPTDPEPTEPLPDDGTVTLEYAFIVPNQAESYLLSIQNRETGEWILEGYSVAPNTKSVILTIKGKGSVVFDLYVGESDESYTSETVEFEPDD